MERGTTDQLFDYRTLQLQLQHQLANQQQLGDQRRSHADDSNSPPAPNIVTGSAAAAITTSGTGITRTSGSLISGSVTSGFVTSGGSTGSQLPLPVGINNMATLSNVVFPTSHHGTESDGNNSNKMDHDHQQLYQHEVDGMEVGQDGYAHVEAKKMARKVGKCRVCGDEASGMYFGAMVCVPCKVSCY